MVGFEILEVWSTTYLYPKWITKELYLTMRSCLEQKQFSCVRTAGQGTLNPEV